MLLPRQYNKLQTSQLYPRVEIVHRNIMNTSKSTETLRVKKVSEYAVLPFRASKGSAGYDLSAAHDCVVPSRGKALVPTDLIIAVPEGTYGRIAPRSSLAWKNFIDVGAGVVDRDYRGIVGVVLFNHAELDFQIKRGDRIAQLVLEQIKTPEVEEVTDIEETERNIGGFGSTGTGKKI